MTDWPHLVTLDDPTATVMGVGLSSDFRLAVAPGSGDPTVYVYRHRSATVWDLVAELDAPSGGSRTASITDDHIAVGGDAGDVWVYDRADLEASPTVLTDAPDTIYDLVLTDEWLVAATGGSGGEVWAVNGWAHETSLTAVPATGRGVDITPDGDHAVVASSAGSLVVFDTDGWTHVVTMTDADDSGWSVAATDEWFVLGTWRDGLYVYDRDAFNGESAAFGATDFGTATFGGSNPLVTHVPVTEADTGQGAVLHHLTTTADESTLLAAGSGATLARIDTTGPMGSWGVDEYLDVETSGAVRSVAVDPGDVYVAAAPATTRATVYDSPIAESGFVNIAPPAAGVAATGTTPHIQTAGSVTIPIPVAGAATTSTPPDVYERTHVTVAVDTAGAIAYGGPDIWGIDVTVPVGTAGVVATADGPHITAAIVVTVTVPASTATVTTLPPSITTTSNVHLSVPTTTATAATLAPVVRRWAKFVSYHTTTGFDARILELDGERRWHDLDGSNAPPVSELHGEYIRDGEWDEPGPQTSPTQ